MLLVSAAKLLRTTPLIFFLSNAELILALFGLSHFCKLPGARELVVMLLLQHWHVL